MTTSRTDVPDIGWAGDLGDDDGSEPRQRHSGMDRHGQADFDPAAVLAALAPRGATAEMPAAQASFDAILERPEWAKSSPPEVVARAWSALETAVEAANDAERAERALDGEQASAQRVEAARVRSLTAAGKVAKPSAGRDFSAEKRHLEAVSAGLREKARRVRVEYEALLEQHREGWCSRIIEQLPSSKAATLKALAMAGQAVERLLGDAEAAQALQLESGGSVASLPTFQIRRFVEATQALAAEIQTSPQLGGVDLCHPRMEPSWAERQQQAAPLLHGVVDSGVHWLAELERREGYRLSSFTRGVPLPKPPESTW